ncbi:MAG: ribosome biogenesis domain-containing protein, partial [Nitrosopumilaceae archaeon]
VNYSKLNKLTTVEAIAGAIYLIGFEKLSLDLLNKFKWGHTFYDLNKELLEQYSKATSQNAIISIANEYQIMA